MRVEMLNEYLTKEDTTKIIINRQDGVVLEVLIDTEDIEKIESARLKIRTWKEKKVKKEKYYAVANYKTVAAKKTFIQLHRFLIDAPKGLVVDHINHNSLDNRKSNLRIVTQSLNMFNRELQINNKSGFFGVFYNIKKQKWVAQIGVNKKTIHLGYFNDKELASIAYKAARKVLGVNVDAARK